MAQAVLLKDVEGLGEAGDAVDVSPGYLRNYLVPRKLAQPATKGALEEAQRRREREAEAERQAAERAGETAALLSKTVLTINHQGRRGRKALRLGHLGGDRRRDPGRPRHQGRPEEDPPRGADPRDRHLHGRGRGRRRRHRLGQDDRRRVARGPQGLSPRGHSLQSRRAQTARFPSAREGVPETCLPQIA